MRHIKSFIIILPVVFLLASCDKDNYKGPNASFHGEFRDIDTGELVPQEIREGSKIYYIEEGWENPPVQDMVIKADGTFRNDLMFAGTYKIILNRGNYVPQDTIRDFKINKGDNSYTFEVKPYIRLKETSITRSGDIVTGRFKIEITTSDPVARYGFFASAENQVSNGMNLTSNIVDDSTVQDGDVLELQFDIEKEVDDRRLLKGRPYYFRLGAQSNAGEARWNYSDVVKIDI